MTVTMDTLFNTVKHPKNKSWNKGDALLLALGTLPMPASELKRSEALTEAILTQRGATDALSLMRREDAGDVQEAQHEADQAASQGVAAPDDQQPSKRERNSFVATAPVASTDASATLAQDTDMDMDSKGRAFM